MHCALCGSSAPLQQSHILPAFLYRWLRETSGTGGHIRNTNNPNLRVQDGLKIPLLCLACESLFNEYETPFATKVFYPFCENSSLRVGYDDWMLKFCVSVSWRVLKYAQLDGRLSSFSETQIESIDGALVQWSDFLCGKANNPGAFEQHLLPMGPIDSHTFPDMPDNMNRYTLRAIDMTIAHGERSIMTYAKLGPMLLFGFVQPPCEEWQGTKIRVRHGIIEPKEFVLPRAMYDFVADRARLARRVYEKMSDKQIAKIDETAEKHIESLMNSKQFEAMMHDHRLFGEAAILRAERPSKK